MKKLTLLFILIIPFFVVGCTKKPVVQKEDEKTSTENITGSIKDILGVGKSVRCTGKYSDSESTVEMIVYASDAKSYTEISTTTPEEGNFNTYSIFDGVWFYTWGDMMPQGTKMQMSNMDDLDIPEGSQNEYEGMNKKFDYKCSQWVVNNNKFIPPSDIEFNADELVIPYDLP